MSRLLVRAGIEKQRYIHIYIYVIMVVIRGACPLEVSTNWKIPTLFPSTDHCSNHINGIIEHQLVCSIDLPLSSE